MEQSMLELSDKLVAARAEKQKADAVLKQASAVCEELEAELIQSMMNAETQSFKRNDVNFCLCNKAYISAGKIFQTDILGIDRRP